jgi:hypothetical protein
MKTIMMCGVLISQLVMLKTCGNTPQALEPGAYVQWVEAPENGLLLTRSIGEYEFALQYKPAEYVVLQENGPGVPAAKLQQGCADIADMEYFTFRIGKKGGTDLLKDDVSTTDQFTSRLAYFSAAMQRDLFVVSGTDTFPCLLFHFERTYGVDPRSTFLLGFDITTLKNGNTPAELIFGYDDKELGTGPVLFTFSPDKLLNLPSVKTN